MKIAITHAAFDATAATMPVGTVVVTAALKRTREVIG
jgi:hypothetical protein